MEGRAKQKEAFAKMLEMTNVPVEERPQAMREVNRMRVANPPTYAQM